MKCKKDIEEIWADEDLLVTEELERLAQEADDEFWADEVRKHERIAREIEAEDAEFWAREASK